MSKVFIEESTLTNIANAIRGKDGTTALISPLDMPSKITNLPTGGGGGDVEPIVFTGDCQYKCAGGLSATYIEKFGNTISTSDVLSPSYMFYKNPIKRIPFAINGKISALSAMSNMFYDADQLEEAPEINTFYPNTLNSMFYNCKRLRSLPANFGENWDYTRLTTSTSSETKSIFSSCYSLRSIPSSFLKKLTCDVAVSSSYRITYGGFSNCYSLDEIVGVPVISGKCTSNTFSNWASISRVKDVIFDMNDDGTPIVAQWKNQSFELTSSVGYTGRAANITEQNNGITAAKQVYDDATYQALKNDPDWFATKQEYSRYNHDSAVNTINSLPDTSEFIAANGGTNTIKFAGKNGSATDGGAINTLTEEEIAVAAAKGWTVTLI